jgi:hypothetical protein
MSYFPDLGTDALVVRGSSIRAIGWLSSSCNFIRGASPSDFVERLRELTAAWTETARILEWPAVAGPHTCELCGVATAAGIVGVPSSDFLYVAPEMALHYVEQHDYLPPQEFIDAVRACPDPATPAFHQAAKPFVYRAG